MQHDLVKCIFWWKNTDNGPIIAIRQLSVNTNHEQQVSLFDFVNKVVEFDAILKQISQ